ncbi:hypothetical protein [Flavobacterium sp. MDT1-60]|uniref:hypothetical protein n=1 Tax=Flavobacterium sp. MDT1-60 TaxID=1979344 RepID=UPI0017820963|nr:hypothetical protein [Flavobacterium sp. MDT1-60]QOG02205.1 hypothetical protein IHE43_20850 [Flavobacterium sp. MDT1-60]
MKKKLLILLLLVFNSCVTNYYYVTIDQDTTIYSSRNGKESIVSIPKGSSVYITRSDKTYSKIKWKNYKGWVINPVYSNTNTLSNSPNTNVNTNYNLSPSKSHSSSTKSYNGGPVYVKGYTRKNGTYVQPHTRSAPKRR